jgi:mannose/fructose/N-acetylgalactosamine-specific phosphotransferase system component IID
MPSVAPITIMGMTVALGHSADVDAFVAVIKSSRIGDGGPLRGVPSTVRTTAVSPITRLRVAVT